MTTRQQLSLWLTAIFVLLLSACSTTLVAQYDPQIRANLVRTSIEIDSFWTQLQATPQDQRQYAKSADFYQAQLINIKVLLKLNQMRPNNDESSKQTENLLTLWQQDMQKHKEKDGFKNFLLKRRVVEYQRIFTAMLAAEDAKDLDKD